MKFSIKLSITIFCTGLVILFLATFTLYKSSQKSIIKAQFAYTQSIANEVSGDINELLHEKVKTALTLANTPIIKNELETNNLSYANLSGDK